ncbi:hypothetical protein CF15_02960 [Pyrodictium occultum]|uniref:Radical SAM core domain-containing protein n=1 Tax=Pyrodictium occultum TaxID=2309 RepID=A0A0V8RUU5_PYROC|nr:radical SAM protein [Pyrodictium occultum]KSW11784.1 hypothetical protein CF15_02960 [Pyrodictium occultum]
MDVLVVDALARGSYGRRIVTVDAIGAGPRTVAGVLEQLGIGVELTTAETVLDKPSMLEDYDVLMISAMSVDEGSVARIVKAWRRRRGRRPVVVGGPISSDPWFLARVGADVGVHGEAEPVVEKLFTEGAIDSGVLYKEKLRSLCGVAYREEGRVVVNKRCPVMPRRVWEKYFPSTRLIRGYPFYWAARVYVEVVRGCSNYTIPRLEGLLPEELLPARPVPGCAYCSVVSLWGYARSRSIELVYREVKELINQGVRRIVLSGPDFLDYGRDWLVEPGPLVDPRRPGPNLEAVQSLLSRLSSIPEISSGEAAIMVENVKPNLVTEEAARTLGRYLKGTPVHVGAETGDQRLLEVLGRPATVRETIEAVRRLRRHGLRPYVYIMYCLPGETARVVEKTLRLMEALYRAGAEKITAYRFTPLPGSALGKLAGRKLDCLPNHPVKLKAAEINKRAKKRMIGWKLRAIVVARHPRLHRWVAYPLHHGPVVLLEEEGLEPGDIVDVRITGVYSDRIIEGSMLNMVGRAV